MLVICDKCTTAYTPGAPRCPHCGSADHHDQGEDMPKNTVKNGPTVNTGDTGVDEPAATPQPEPAEPAGPPARSAPKSDWTEYAVGLGAGETVLAGSKSEIQAWVDAQ